MSNKGNIKTSILLLVLKWKMKSYSNRNEKFDGQALFKLRAVEYAIPFFSISNLWYFSRDFCQKVYETILFQLKFQKPISRCSILQKIKMSNFVILKWRPFEYKVKSWKICPFLGLFFRNKKCWHFEFFMNQIFR